MTHTLEKLDFTSDEAWVDIALNWQIRPDTVYLNHGSFGHQPNPVRFARQEWIKRLDEQPMDFYTRQFEPLLMTAREKMAGFVGTKADNLIFVENATYGMNVVANSFPLSAGEQVLLNNHEYGAVHRIWERACSMHDALKVSINLPSKIESRSQLIESVLSGVTDRTKLVVISHITSATALILPIKEICSELASRGIASCVDGPHAPAHVNLNIEDIGCDFYTASCHKWLCAPLGSGFLYVHPKWHEKIEPPVKSWGRLLPAIPERWDEEFTWLGSRDPSGFLGTSAAIDFMEGVGLDAFRERSYWLAAQAEKMLMELFGTEPMASREDGWYGTMAHVPLPDGDWSKLQQQLWLNHGIEIPIINFDEKWYVRVSCHLYNNTKHFETLYYALGELTGIKVS